MIKNFRDMYALILLGVLCSWLILVVSLVAVCLFILRITPAQLDPMITLIAGLGIGGVTNAFLVLIALITQFYFRKANAEELVK